VGWAAGRRAPARGDSHRSRGRDVHRPTHLCQGIRGGPVRADWSDVYASPKSARARRGGGTERSRSSRRSRTDQSFDIVAAIRFAYGVLGWSPDRFWASTIAEFHFAQQGYLEEIEQTREREAGWVAILATGLFGEAITPAQLLGREDEARDSRKDQALAHLKAMEKKMKRAGLIRKKGKR
jgi:hypothetical protein